MNERVLVTGAAGFIGSHVAERLLARGDRVVGVDNFDPFYDRALKEENLEGALRHPRFRFVDADCADLPALSAALDGSTFDVVVHLAAKAGVRPSLEDPVAYAVANVVGTEAMLELARRRGVRRFVFGSSSSVYGNAPKVPFAEHDPVFEPISPYAATKLSCELMCRTHHQLYGISTIALRFFTVYGPRQRPDLAIRKFATRLLRGQPIPLYGDGTSERDYTWIDDIVNGVVAAIDYTGRDATGFEIINLGGNRTTSLLRLVGLISEALGVRPGIERHDNQPGDVVRTYADVAKARRLLGFVPRVAIEDGIPRFVHWLKTHECRHAAQATGPTVPAGTALRRM